MTNRASFKVTLFVTRHSDRLVSQEFRPAGRIRQVGTEVVYAGEAFPASGRKGVFYRAMTLFLSLLFFLNFYARLGRYGVN